MPEFLHKRDFFADIFQVIFQYFCKQKAASESWLLIKAESKADHVVCELRVLYLISRRPESAFEVR